MASSKYTRRLKYDLTGQQFGFLLVLRYEKTERRACWWRCVCECGTETVVPTSRLRKGHTRSCGCWGRSRLEARVTHNQSNTRLYKRWKGMIARCENPHHIEFHNYGARGIRVCERWRTSFMAFVEDMGAPQPGMSLERLDVNGPYTPDNCVWASPRTQANNQRHNRLLTFHGLTQNVTQWAQFLGMSTETLAYRLRTWNDVARALSTPVDTRQSRRKADVAAQCEASEKGEGEA